MGKKKKICSLFTVASIILVFALMGNAQAGQLSVTLEAGDYEIVDIEDGYQEIRMEDFGYAGESPGTPRLPARIFQIALPPGAKVTSVDVEGLREEIPGQFKIAPAPPARPFDSGDDIESIVKESRKLWQENYDEIYSSDTPYPGRIAWQINYGSLRNIPYVDVIFFPFAYQPRSGTLSICKSIEVVITYSIEPSPIMHDPLPGIFMNEAERLFINYEDIKEHYSVLGKGRGTADYLIILYDSTSTTVDAIQPLINWKKSRGYTVKVVDCGNTGYTATGIRNYLRSHYSGWGTMYVLLVAPAIGATDIPMRHCYAINHATDAATDYYYAELSLPDNQSWDSDGDGWYGEYSDDNVTFVPEVYVGRIPFNPNTEHDLVRDICEKMIDCEHDMGSWKDNALLLGAIAYFQGGGHHDCSAEMEYTRTNVSGLTYHTMYEKEDDYITTPACTWPLNQANVVARWDTGIYGVVLWASHGGLHSVTRNWKIGGTVHSAHFLDDGDASNLSGTAPIVFASSCWTGNVENGTGCLAMDLLENDATAAYMGATRVSWNNQPWLTYFFAEHVMETSSDSGQVGRAFYNGKVDYWNNYGGNKHEQANMLIFNLYGEPNMLRDGTNALPNITYTTPTGWDYPIVPRGDGSASWTNCHVPSTLPGNSYSTYLNWAMRNSGTVIARNINSRVYLDDVYVAWGWVEFINPGSNYGHNNIGILTVRGGRHTLMDSLDWTHTIYETNEYDNRYRRQFIWSPYQLANQIPVSRSAPPLRGSMTYPNCDGFSFPDGGGTWWRGVGILPTGSGNDYDLRLHNDYTGSTQGFGTYLESSSSWGTQSDFVLVNENGTAPSGTYYAGVNRYSGGTSNFRVQRADDGTTIYAPDTTGTFIIHNYDIIDVHEIRITQTGMYRFTLDNLSGTANLGISLYDAHQPYFGKWDYMTGAYANSNPGGQDESFTVEINTTGWFGFVVWKSDHTDLGNSNQYRIMIESKPEGTWEGDVSSNWHTSGNWFGGSVPSSTMDVLIPAGTLYSPVISTGHGYCRNLTVNSGATLTITNKTLHADGDVLFYGTINTSGSGYYISCRGNWLDYGTFNPGTGYYVVFDGSVTQYIVNGEFYNVSIYSGAHVRVLWSNLQINGWLPLHGTLDTYSSGYNVSANSITVYGTGLLDARGLNVSSNNNIRIESGGTIDLDDDDASISAGIDIVIDGTLDCGTSSPEIYCGDDWIDTSGTFVEGYSTVIFDGAGTQQIRGGETFYDVTVDKSTGRVQPYGANVAIHSLDIASGTFDLNTRDANITSDAIIRGHLEMNHVNDDFNVGDDLTWDATATATVTTGEIRCGDDFDVYGGANIQLAGGKVIFNGSGNGYIHMYDPNFAFNNVEVGKDSSHWIKISSYSTYPVDVNGYFIINPFAEFDTKYKTLEVAGSWTNNGIFTPTGGKVIFDGTSQVINNGSGNFWDLECNASGAVTTAANLDINGDFTIANGTFNLGTYLMFVGGDWNDTCGVFHPANTGNWVLFDGAGQQLIYQRGSNYFQGVEIWNTGTPNQVRAETDLTFLYYFNITSGDFNVNGRDLIISRALMLGYNPSHNGNLTQYDGTIWCEGVRWYAGTVDLQGGLICSSFDNAPYPDWNDALITFQASGDHTVEMVGSSDVTITQGPGNHFNNLIINKYARRSQSENQAAVRAPITYTGLLPPSNPPKGKANTATANTGLDIDGDFTLSDGTFVPAAFVHKVAGNWNSTGGTFHPGSGTIEFDGNGAQSIAQGTGNYFHTVKINNSHATAGVNPSTDLDIRGHLNITDGKLAIDGQSVDVDSLLTTASGTELEINAGSVVTHLATTAGFYGTMDINGGSFTATNYYMINPGAVLDISSGSFDITGSSQNWWKGNITMSGGTIDLHWAKLYGTFTENITDGTIKISGYWNDALAVGTFTPMGGTVEFDGTGDKTVVTNGSNNFYNLLINKGSKHNMPLRKGEHLGDLVEYDQLADDRGNSITCLSSLDINGDLNISNGIFVCGNNTLSLAGDWINDVGEGGFNEGTGNVIFDGVQNAHIGNNETFYDLTLDKTYAGYNGLEFGTQGAGKNINVLNDLDIIDGTAEINVPCTLDVEGDIQISLNAGLNANDGSNIQINVGNDWIDYNPVISDIKGFSYGYSTVSFDGGGDQDIVGDSVNFYNLSLASTNPTPYLADLELFGTNKLLRIHNDLHLERGGMGINANSILNVDGDVLIDSAAGLDADEGGIKIYIGGNWTNTGNIVIGGGGPSDGFDELNSSVVFDGTGDSHIGDDTFDTLKIDKGGSKDAGTLTFGEISDVWYEEVGNERYGTDSFDGKASNTAYADSTIIAADIWVDNGTFETDGHTVCATHNLNIDDTLKIDACAILQIGDTLNVNSTGVLECSGVDTSSMVTVTRTGTGYYAFTVNSEGTISPVYTVFEYMDLNGINVKDGAIIDASTGFEGCTFCNGEAGGTLLRIDNAQGISIQDAVFPENTWGGLYNVTKLQNHGVVEFVYPFGDFAGEDYDNDPYDRIDWLIDATGPLISQMCPPQDTVIPDSLPTISAFFCDSGTGIDTSSVILVLDDDTVDALVTDSTVSYTPDTALSDTVHGVILYVSDDRDNETIASWQFEVDAHAPVSPGLLSPADSSWLGDTTVCFEWGEVLKGTAGSPKCGVGGKEYEVGSPDGIVKTFHPVRNRYGTGGIDKQYGVGGKEHTVDGEVRRGLSERSPAFHGVDSEHTLAGGVTAGKHRNADPKDSEVSYIIQIDTSDSFDNPVVVDTTETNIDTVNLSEAHYYWKVRAFDQAGNVGDFSSVWEFAIDITPPASFDLVSPQDSVSLAMTSPTFVWQASSDIGCGLEDYEVYIDGTLRHTVADTFWTADYDLSEDYHSWYVIAYDSVDNSRQSNQTWTVLIDTTAPPVVSLISPLDGSCLGNSTVDLTWNSADDNLSGIDHYLLEYADNSPFSASVDTEITDTTHTVILSDTTYYWRVKSVDKATNESDWSLVWEFTVDTQTPDIPNPGFPTDSSIISDNTPSFSWSKVTKKTTLAKNRRGTTFGDKATDITYTLAIILNMDTAFYQTPDTVYTPDDTLSDSTYQWQVQAEDEAGNKSGYSGPFTLFIDTRAPEIESTTVWGDTSYTGPFSIYSTVGDENGVSSVELWYKTSVDTNWVNIAMDTAKGVDQYLAEIPEQSENTEVYYYIDALDNAAPPNEATDPRNAPDSSYSFTVTSGTGIMEEKPIPKVFFLSQNCPNPFSHSTRIEFGLPRDSHINMVVYNLSGQRVITLVNEQKRAGYYDIMWNGVSAKGMKVSHGIYFCRLETEDFCCIKKMILIR